MRRVTGLKLGLLTCVLAMVGCAPLATKAPVPVVESPRTPDNHGAKVETELPPKELISHSGAKIRPLLDAPVIREQKTQGQPAVAGTWYKSNTASVERMPIAAKTLVHDASAAIQAKDYEQADRLLSRAQRMAPSAAPVYYETARLRLVQQRYSQAETLAKKGMSVANNRTEVLKALWALVADIRDEAGDLIGAQKARLQVRRYR